MTTLNKAQIQTASELITQVQKWREDRLIASDMLNLSVHYSAPTTVSHFQRGENRNGTGVIEPGRISTIKAIIIEQLDAQIAAGEAELAKLGVTAD